MVTDGGRIQTLSGNVRITNEIGEEVSYELTEWEVIENGYRLTDCLEQNGKYQISIYAKDEAGNERCESRQVIVDQEGPIINGLEQWEGKKISKFQWDYRKEAVINDFTSTSYVVYLDGAAYTTNEVISSPGSHELVVRAKDVAGNITEKRAMFTIKKQIDMFLGRGAAIVFLLFMKTMIKKWSV